LVWRSSALSPGEDGEKRAPLAAAALGVVSTVVLFFNTKDPSGNNRLGSR
jgi:hypothetical protein